MKLEMLQEMTPSEPTDTTSQLIDALIEHSMVAGFASLPLELKNPDCPDHNLGHALVHAAAKLSEFHLTLKLIAASGCQELKHPQSKPRCTCGPCRARKALNQG